MGKLLCDYTFTSQKSMNIMTKIVLKKGYNDQNGSKKVIIPTTDQRVKYITTEYFETLAHNITVKQLVQVILL